MKKLVLIERTTPANHLDLSKAENNRVFTNFVCGNVEEARKTRGPTIMLVVFWRGD